MSPEGVHSGTPMKVATLAANEAIERAGEHLGSHAGKDQDRLAAGAVVLVGLNGAGPIGALMAPECLESHLTA